MASVASRDSSAGAKTKRRALAPGIWAPVPTFFTAGSEELDVQALQKHVVRLATAGIGSVVSGSTGEAVHLVPGERAQLVRAARSALDDAGFPDMPLIAGTGAASTYETIRHCREAAEAGADYVLVLTSSFFAATYNESETALVRFYTDIADASAVPVLVYNYPGVSGVDLSSDVILRLAQHPNIVGTKLTCANVGKLVRIAAVTADPAFTDSGREGFYCFGGYSDFLLPGLLARSSGAITGLANVAPRTVKRCFDLGVQAITTCSAADLRAAQAVQDVVARADAVLAGTGIAGTKALLASHHGYGGAPRRPLEPLGEEALKKLEAGMKEIIQMEIALSD